MQGNATFQDIVNRKTDFAGKVCRVTVGMGSELYCSGIIQDVEIVSNCIMISFSDRPGGEVVLPAEEVSAIYLNAQGFQIHSQIYSCTCEL